MSTYQDVVNASAPLAAWSLTEAAGTDHPPYAGSIHLTDSGTLLYQQTGPFVGSFAEHLAVGAALRTPAFTQLVGPFTEEVWFKLDSSPPASVQPIVYWGNLASNGTGIIVLTSGHLAFQESGVNTYDTGYVVDSNWHLYEYGNIDSSSAKVAIAVDGLVVAQINPAAFIFASPVAFGFGSSASTAATVGCSVAMPAIYPRVMDAVLPKQTYLAATDPNNAIQYAAGGGTLNLDILNEILAAVRKTFPTTH